jgi:hypothetical protein
MFIVIAIPIFGISQLGSNINRIFVLSIETGFVGIEHPN